MDLQVSQTIVRNQLINQRIVEYYSIQQYEWMIENQIKENEKAIYQQKLNIITNETLIKEAKETITITYQKGDVKNTTDDRCGAKIIILLGRNIKSQLTKELVQKIQARTQKLSQSFLFKLVLKLKRIKWKIEILIKI